MVNKDSLISKPICPKCHATSCIKDGVVKQKQRFKCKACGYRHTVAHRGFSLEIRRQALQLYLAGLGFRSIGRLLKCSHVTVSQWIHSYGDSIISIRPEGQVKTIKINEMQTQIEPKFAVKEGVTLIFDSKTNSTVVYIPVTSTLSSAES
jgi:transposase-like protein